jgi:CRISPR system Cascade subunit CasA
VKTDILPKHPKPGVFGYGNWRGIVLQAEGADRAACLQRYLKHHPEARFHLLVGGWAMANMSPLDFLWSGAPVFPLGPAGAALAGYALAAAIKQGMGEDELSTGAAHRARSSFRPLKPGLKPSWTGSPQGKEQTCLRTGWRSVGAHPLRCLTQRSCTALPI